MSSDEGKTSPPAEGNTKPKFTPKEEEVMRVAWRCLKSGPPEVDIKLLKEAGGFNTEKTAGNSWGVIKKKLLADADGSSPTKATNSSPSTTKAAKKGTAVSKKRGKAAAADDDNDDEEVEDAPVKKRKSPVKKEAIKDEDTMED